MCAGFQTGLDLARLQERAAELYPVRNGGELVVEIFQMSSKSPSNCRVQLGSTATGNFFAASGFVYKCHAGDEMRKAFGKERLLIYLRRVE